MAKQALRQQTAKQVPCEQCPLRALPLFRPFEPTELAFISTFKRGELSVDRGATVLAEGNHSAHLYTVLSGWGFRYKLMRDGRRQILNYLLPGDLVGLQASLAGEMEHSVEALSPMVLCVFERSQLKDLYEGFPGLAFDVTWIASREEQMLDENLLSIGRRTAIERAAYLLSFLAARARAIGLQRSAPYAIPITQQHIADTLGLSLVHTNRTLRKLAGRQLVAWRGNVCEVLDLDALTATARWRGLSERQRPLI